MTLLTIVDLFRTYTNMEEILEYLKSFRVREVYHLREETYVWQSKWIKYYFYVEYYSF